MNEKLCVVSGLRGPVCCGCCCYLHCGECACPCHEAFACGADYVPPVRPQGAASRWRVVRAKIGRPSKRGRAAYHVMCGRHRVATLYGLPWHGDAKALAEALLRVVVYRDAMDTRRENDTASARSAP